MTRRVGQLLVAMCAAALCACGQFQDGPKPDEGLFAPVLNPITPVNLSLRTLPPPERRVAVAVYGYTDQTGQFKPADAVQQLSRAVTQGATSVLIKALQDAGDGSWFTVVERERLENLLKERRIITDMRMRYLGEKTVNSQALPPLLFAGILLEGGIIGFDSNTRTGGIGARYLGIGGDIKYKEDTVTIYLRAISTKTGEVLVSTVSHKTVCSYGIQGGAFKFVSIDEILEAEAGITRNEPEQLAVQQAIEKAVHAMIVEGSARGLWAFANKAYQADLIYRYDAEQASYRHAQAKTPDAPAYAAGASTVAGNPVLPEAGKQAVLPEARKQAAPAAATTATSSRASGATTANASAPVSSAAPSNPPPPPAQAAAPAPPPPTQATSSLPAPPPLAPPPVAENVKKEAQELAALESAQAAFAGNRPLPWASPKVLPKASEEVLPKASKRVLPEAGKKNLPEARVLNAPGSKSKGSKKVSKAHKPREAPKRLAKALSDKVVPEAGEAGVSREPLANAEEPEVGTDGLEEDPGWSHLDVLGKPPAPVETGSIGAP